MNKPPSQRRGLRRLPHFDYTATTAYFVTICTHDRDCCLSVVENGCAVLTDLGFIVERFWNNVPEHYPAALDVFVIMPNHVHAILFIQEDQRAGRRPALHEIVRSFKTFSAIALNKARGATGQSFWQRNYYERVIRNERELHKVREYIINNPVKWLLNRESHDKIEWEK